MNSFGFGLSAHIDSIHRMMQQANRKDEHPKSLVKPISLEDLSNEIMEEMESDRYPKHPNYYKEYGKAIAIVRTVYQIPVDGIAGLEPNEVQDIEAGRIYPRASNLCCYSEAIGITLDEFLDKVATNVEVLKVFEAIA